MRSRFWTCAPVIARALVLSEKTVKTHVSSILAKLGSDASAAGDNPRALTGERISDSEADWCCQLRLGTPAAGRSLTRQPQSPAHPSSAEPPTEMQRRAQADLNGSPIAGYG